MNEMGLFDEAGQRLYLNASSDGLVITAQNRDGYSALLELVSVKK